MIFSGDPYQTLGLPPGAPLAEVKRAYRRLAKQYHPDTAGPAALPRFLAIKAAYEMLAGPPRGRTGGTRPAWRSNWQSRPAWQSRPGFGAAGEAGAARRGAGSAPSGPDGATPGASGARAGAGSTRSGPGTARPDAGRPGPDAGRPRPGAGGGTDQDPFAWARHGPPPRDERRRGSTAPPGSSPPHGSTAPPRPGAERHRPEEDDRARPGPRRAEPTGEGSPNTRPGGGAGSRGRRTPTRRATLGSTSYDDALHEEERVWHGAAWYGVTTGTYWRPNPREYADPRKHGPEYEERARRAASAWDGTARFGDGGGARSDAAPDGPVAGPARRSEPSTERSRAGAHRAAEPGKAARRGAGVERGTAEPGTAEPGTAESTTTPGPDRPVTGSRPVAGSRPFAGSRPVTGARPSFGRATTQGRREPSVHALADRVVADRVVAALLGTPARARLFFAVAGWPLLALLIVGALGELTGCGRYAAACPLDADAWTAATRLGAGVLFALLFALPRLALRAAIAGLVALVVAAPTAALLAVFGGSRDPAGAAGALTLVVALAWSVGAIGAASGRLRLPPTLRARVPWWS